MTHVICCYHKEVHPLARAALDKYSPGVEYVETEGLFGYPKAVAERWLGKEDLVIVEADKEILADTLPSFEACDKLWCTVRCMTLPPPHTRHTVNSLAAAKFSVEVQQLVKTSDFNCRDPWWAPCRRCDSQGCWNQLDTRLAIAISPHANGLPHVHGWVNHHHEYDEKWQIEFDKDWDYMMEFNARLMEINSVEEIINYGK